MLLTTIHQQTTIFMRNIVFTLCALLSLNIVAQNITEAKEVQESLIQKEQLHKKSIVKNINFNNIGPTIMSGRVADVDVNPDNPTEFYVGYASGGLWYTNNNGTTFTPVLDNSPTQNVGDIAIDWKSGTIWVGTGEKNSSRSSSPCGIFATRNEFLKDLVGSCSTTLEEDCLDVFTWLFNIIANGFSINYFISW